MPTGSMLTDAARLEMAHVVPSAGFERRGGNLRGVISFRLSVFFGVCGFHVGFVYLVVFFCVVVSVDSDSRRPTVRSKHLTRFNDGRTDDGSRYHANVLLIRLLVRTVQSLISHGVTSS